MRKTIIYLGIIFWGSALNAQISTEEIPYSWKDANRKIAKQSIPIKTLPFLDMEGINKVDKENETLGDQPIRFGFSHDVNFDLTNSGTWQTTPDGGRLWNLRIHSPDAISLNLLYDKFWLPDGAKFFIYSEDKEQHIGAFTSKNNNQDEKNNIMGFATGFLFTNTIILEYYEPKEIENKGIISISHIISGYRYIYDIVKTENSLKHNNTTLSCHNDVNCLVGNNYQNEKNAIAYMVMGNYICTGALLNTTANDNSPIFLTANHCFVSSPESNQWIFYWNYESSCGGGAVNPSSNKSTAGANILARMEASDFMLLRLIGDPANNSNINIFYLGWDRTTNLATQGACIHHPRGAQKKISITTNTVNNYPFAMSWNSGITTPPNSHWQLYWTNGAIEGGSSGSPLLNQHKRVIGQLHGHSGTNNCPPNKTICYYGRFDVSWNGGGTPNSRLKDWLDPLNTNATILDGRTYLLCSSPNITIPNSTIRTPITQNKTVNGCNINVQNTVIQNGAKLTIDAGNTTTINGNFEVKLGSQLEIK